MSAHLSAVPSLHSCEHGLTIRSGARGSPRRSARASVHTAHLRIPHSALAHQCIPRLRPRSRRLSGYPTYAGQQGATACVLVSLPFRAHASSRFCAHRHPAGLSLPRWTLAQSQTASVPAENPILYAKAAWHKQAHPMAEQIKEVTPSFPRAGLWTALSAVPCLRKAFRDQGPQDMRVYSQVRCQHATQRSFDAYVNQRTSKL